MATTRVGLGYDVHGFTDGDQVVLAGISIPHDRSLLGHSDADVVMHALTDAILGALADGDIGTHFPPSDQQWKDAASDIFLKFAAERVSARGGTISNVDVMLMCEAPRIADYRDAMCDRLAEILGIQISTVSIKATTNEGIGFVGRKEGIAAQATVAIELPEARETKDIMFPSQIIEQTSVLIEKCRNVDDMIASAESCTGGLISAAITAVAGSSDVFDRGFTTYSNEAKSDLLGVPAALIAEHGAVSTEVAAAMAEGALARSNATLAVSVTGVAGPGGGSAEKPVGLVFLGFCRKGSPPSVTELRLGDIGRDMVRAKTVAAAIEGLLDLVGR